MRAWAGCGAAGLRAKVAHCSSERKAARGSQGTLGSAEGHGAPPSSGRKPSDRPQPLQELSRRQQDHCPCPEGSMSSLCPHACPSRRPARRLGPPLRAPGGRGGPSPLVLRCKAGWAPRGAPALGLWSDPQRGPPRLGAMGATVPGCPRRGTGCTSDLICPSS